MVMRSLDQLTLKEIDQIADIIDSSDLNDIMKSFGDCLHEDSSSPESINKEFLEYLKSINVSLTLNS